MRVDRLLFLLLLVLSVSNWVTDFSCSADSATLEQSKEPPIIPVGLDAYRMWERWPYQRIGARAYMRSTYDRTGGNETADAGHFLYQEADNFNVTLDVETPGVLYFARYNHWHGSPWHYEVDGVDHIVQETSSANPLNPVDNSVFMPEHLFPNPLAWTWSVTKGADLTWVPIAFERSFRMAYSRTRYGTGYYIYHHYLPDANLSRPIVGWDAGTPPDPGVLELINRAGTDIAPKNIASIFNKVELDRSGTVPLCTIQTGPAMIRALEMSVPRDKALEFGHARLRITWDNRDQPSVDAPVSLFFGAGILYNRDDRHYVVKAFPMNVRYEAESVHLACYFPMPFFKSARIELTNVPAGLNTQIKYAVRHEPYTDPPNHTGYFHATYRDHPEPETGRDLVLLDTQDIEGQDDWSGSFVGTSFIFSHRAFLPTLEGDPRFFFDDSMTPQAYGTGTEEWGGGGDYWGGRNMTLPFAGHPVGAKNPELAISDEDLVNSAYRFLLADLMPFGKRAVIRLEHGSHNQSTEHYETVTYWYGLPSPSLVKTDALNVGNLDSERAHNYISPDSSPPVSITSRYELGPDTAKTACQQKPKANPDSYAEFEFQADADKTYYIWIRGKGMETEKKVGTLWMQFDDEIGTDKANPTYHGETGAGNWRDRDQSFKYAWSSGSPNRPPLTVTFERPGKHRLRIQPRILNFHSGRACYEPEGMYIDQIWLSAENRELPRNNVPVAKRKEIVLDVSDIVASHGGNRTVEDEDVSIGKTLYLTSTIEVYPTQTQVGRHTSGTSEFTVKLRPDNLGVMLRRTLDYSFPNQRAEVYVADTRAGQTGDDHEWKHAGVWYLAGSNTCVYSNPPRGDELGATKHIVQTSNRRFRDDEFLVARKFTQGRSAVRVKIKFTPVKRPLFPGHPLPELAWSELRYDVYCYVMPESPVKD